MSIATYLGVQMLTDTLANAGVLAILSLIVVFVPLIMGISYAIWPNEARLALMRPFSLAGIFAALCGFFAGAINVLVAVAKSPNGFADRVLPVGLAEAMVPLFVGFGCLTIAWLCVALGLRRQGS
jgi:hypothetical protein